MDKQSKPRQINVRVTADEYAKLQERAREENRTIGNLLQNVVRGTLDSWKEKPHDPS